MANQEFTATTIENALDEIALKYLRITSLAHAVVDIFDQAILSSNPDDTAHIDKITALCELTLEISRAAYATLDARDIGGEKALSHAPMQLSLELCSASTRIHSVASCAAELAATKIPLSSTDGSAGPTTYADRDRAERIVCLLLICAEFAKEAMDAALELSPVIIDTAERKMARAAASVA